jgi:chromosome segregation ATPase
MYRKEEDLAESQKEAFSKLERKVVEQGEVIREQSIRINELENLVKQRENELTHLKKNYELEIQRLNDMAAKLQKQSDDQASKINSVEKKMKEEADIYKYKEEDLQLKISGLEKKINDLENEAKKNEETIKGLNQQLEISAAKANDLEKKLREKEAEMASMESIIMEDVNYKPYFIVKRYGSSSIQDIKKALGLQEGVVRRVVLELEKKGLLRVNGEQVRLAQTYC